MMTVSTLDALQRAIERGDSVEVFSLADDLDEAFERDRERESRYDALGIGIRYAASVRDDVIDTVDEYAEEVVTLEQRRIALEQALLGYLTNETPTKTVIEMIQDLSDGYQILEQRREELIDVKTSVSLPPILSLSQIPDTDVSVGESIALETTVSNLGNGAAMALSVDIESEMDTTYSPATIEELPGDANQNVTIRFESDQAGSFPVEINVGNDRYSESIGFRITVLDRVGYLEQARAFAEAGGNVVANSNDRSGRSLRGIGNQLSRIGDQLEKIISRIERGNRPDHAIINQLHAILNRLNAIENQLSSASGKRSNPIFEQEVKYYLEKITTNITASIELSPDQEIDDERTTRTKRIRPTDAHRTRTDVPGRGRGIRDRVPGNARTPPGRDRGRGFERS